MSVYCVVYFFFNDTATTEIYTLSLHDALPIFVERPGAPTTVEPHERPVHLHDAQAQPVLPARSRGAEGHHPRHVPGRQDRDRKSTRLNSSHANISYAVFCLKKKK